MAKLTQLIVDCEHPAALARFWAEVLDDFAILPYDDDEVARLASLGLTSETDSTVILAGPGLELCFQRVDVVDVAKKPMHVDVATPHRAEEVQRLVELGATVQQDFDGHTWMRDPAGNDFCVVEDCGPR